MKVVLVFRKKIAGRYSLENVFNPLKPYLNKNHKLKIYYTNGWKFLLMDIFFLRSMKADVYHIVGDVNYFSIFLPKKKTVLTIPDIGHYTQNLKNFKKFFYKLLWIKLPIHSSFIVTTISKFSKKQILKTVKKNYQIKVIPCSYRKEIKFSKRKINKHKLKILFIGTGKNKNLKSLINTAKFTNWKITIVGKISLHDKFLLKKYKIQYKNFINLSFKDIIKTYKVNDILCFISLHEGFGLPIIEAQKSGMPVVASNIEPIKSVAGNGALLVNPMKTRDIKKNILKIANNVNYKNQLVLNGVKNIRRYQPSIIANQYNNIYKKLIKYYDS